MRAIRQHFRRAGQIRSPSERQRIAEAMSVLPSVTVEDGILTFIAPPVRGA